jgi:hypothetical protein
MKSLGFLTHQEIFNHSLQHLFSQAQAPCCLVAAAHIGVTAVAVRPAVSLSRATT